MSLLSPSSIAVIGASTQEGKVGHEILKNILTQGYKGQVYPVNPKRGEILGKTAYATVEEIPGTVDLAIIVTPAATVPDLLRDCGKKGIHSVIVISAGFGETGTEQGHAREQEVRAIAMSHKITLLGVNCLGLLRPSIRLNASFAKELPEQGSIAFISQSGALAVGIMDAARTEHLGFSFVASIGNETCLNECDLLEMAMADPETRVIGMYVEGIRDGQRMRALTQRAHLPIVLLKSGTSVHGQKAVSSHTGSLAGSDAAIDALCADTGILRASSAEEFVDTLAGLSMQPPLLSRNVAIITNAGGLGILATDAAEHASLVLPTLTEAGATALATQLPPAASVKNPIDVLGDADAPRYAAALKACISDPTIDGICVLLTPQVMTPVEKIARVLIDAHKHSSLMPIVSCFMGSDSVDGARDILRKAGIPCFESPERAVRTLASLLHTDTHLPLSHIPLLVQRERSKQATEIIGPEEGLLAESTIRDLFELYELALPDQALAQSPEEAAHLALNVGFPVVAKVSSPHILHKTDVGGVVLNIQSATQASEAYHVISRNVQEKAPTARVGGVLIQQQLPAGSEFIVGGLRDASFGPLVMAGLGGIYTELFRDTSFRLAPIGEEHAYSMLHELSCWKLLLGLRGSAQLDIPALARTLTIISQMMVECPTIAELDLNPVILRPEGLTIADAKVVVRHEHSNN